MWSRFKKRFFGGSRKTADDASSLDETIVHACVLTDADDVRKSRQTLQQFAKDDLHAVSTPADKKGNASGGGGKLKRKLSWFGAKSRRTTKSTTSLNSDKRRSADGAVLMTKTTTTTTSAASETASAVQTSAAQPAAEPGAVTTTTASSATDKPLSDGVVGGDRPAAVVDSVVRITSSKTSASLLNIDKSLMVSRDDVWCSRVEFTADKGTFGASSASHIEELQRPASLPVSTDADVKSSPPKLKRRAKAVSQSETETRKSRLSKNLPEPLPTSSSGERLSTDRNMTTSSAETETSAQVTTAASVDAVDTTEHLKSNAAAHGPSTSSASACGKRVPPPVPVRKYPPSSTAVSGSAENSPEALSVKTAPSKLVAAATTAVEEGQVSPSPTRNSPDSASDDTEGKESGYVTLDDLQAQLMRSSWSSDERDVTDSHSSTAVAASLQGIRFCCCSSC